MNLTPGGRFGYCSSKCITSRKVPSSNGVSAGPIMTAFLPFSHQSTGLDLLQLASQGLEKIPYHVMTLSAIGEAETPAGGSVCMRYSQSISIVSQRKSSTRCMMRLSHPFILRVYIAVPLDMRGSGVQMAYFEVTHQSTTGRGRHSVGSGRVWNAMQESSDDLYGFRSDVDARCA